MVLGSESQIIVPFELLESTLLLQDFYCLGPRTDSFVSSQPHIVFEGHKLSSAVKSLYLIFNDRNDFFRVGSDAVMFDESCALFFSHHQLVGVFVVFIFLLF